MSKNNKETTVAEKQREFLADTSHADYTNKVLEVQNLKKYFHVGTGKDRLTVKAVDDVSFDIYKREVFGLVGESGCGKTTTGRTIIRLYKTTDGRVYLNGNLVTAGFQKHRDKIAKIKNEAKEEIKKLEPFDENIYQINTETQIKVEDIQHQIEVLKTEQKQAITKLNEPIETYKIQKYQVKKDHGLTIDHLKYQYNLEKENIESKTINIYKNEYRSKVNIEKTTFKNKLSGLKDSAALTKEEIQLRIEKLKKTYDENLVKLEEEYMVLIDKAEEQILTKADVAPQIQELKEKLNHDIGQAEKQYEGKFAAIIVPDFDGIKLSISEVKQNTRTKIDELKAQIKTIQQESQQKVIEAKANKQVAIKKFNTTKQDNVKAAQNDKEKELKALSDKYLPLIKAESSKVLPKSDFKAELSKLKEKQKNDLVKLEKTHKEKLAELKEKQKELKESKESLADLKKQKLALVASFKEAKTKVNTTFKTQKDKLVNKTINKKEVEYNQEKAKLVEKHANLIKIASSYDGIYKLKADAIKNEMNEKVAVEREEIKRIKYANRSKEAQEKALEMQMIFQDPIASLNPRMTVKEIIGEGLVIKGTHTKKEIDAEVDKALELVGLSTDYKTRYPHEFSGGQRQRIGIARALIMKPTFIIADEPISALDVSIRAQVINLLTQLKHELGLTILFIAHDLSVVRFFCDRIAVMYYGKIVELAPSEELFNHPMHPYTQSLLSAIPQPDPDYEKGRKRINYNPMQHDYRRDKPKFREIANGHFVLANDKEFEIAKKEYQKQKEGN